MINTERAAQPAIRQRLTQISRTHVDLRSQISAVERIHALIERSPATPGQMLVMETEPSLGKSRVIDIVRGEISSNVSRAANTRICRVECLPGTDGAQLAQLLVSELKIPAFAINKPARFGVYLRDNLAVLGVSLLAVENAHTLLRDGTQPNRGVVEILGAVVASGAAPLLLSGRAGALRIGESLLRSVGQSMELVSLSALPYTNGTELSQIAAYLGVFAAEINTILQGTGIVLRLHDDDSAKRFWGGSWGIPGHIVDIIKEGVRSLLEERAASGCRDRYQMRPKDFAEAWRTQFARTSPLPFNPFSRHDPPALGEMSDALRMAREREEKIELPRAPTAKGAALYA